MEPLNSNKRTPVFPDKSFGKKFRTDSFLFGFGCGLLGPVLVFLIYYKINYSYIRLHTFIGDTFVKNIFTPLLSLCVIINLGIFFLFYWLYKNYAARGVIGATFVYAILVVILKLGL